MGLNAISRHYEEAFVTRGGPGSVAATSRPRFLTQILKGTPEFFRRFLERFMTYANSGGGAVAGAVCNPMHSSDRPRSILAPGRLLPASDP